MLSRLTVYAEIVLSLLSLATVPYSILGSHIAREMLPSLATIAYVLSLLRSLKSSSKIDVIAIEAVTPLVLLVTPYYILVVGHIHAPLIISVTILILAFIGLIVAIADTEDVKSEARMSRIVVFACIWSILISTVTPWRDLELYITLLLTILLSAVLGLKRIDREVIESYLDRLISKLIGRQYLLMATVLAARVWLSEALLIDILHRIVAITGYSLYKMIEITGVTIFNLAVSLIDAIVDYSMRTLTSLTDIALKIERSHREVYRIMEKNLKILISNLESYIRADIGLHVLVFTSMVLIIFILMIIAK